MVLYFSGTGNSQFAALQLAKAIGDGEAVSINRYMKAGTNPVIHSERPLVFVAPTYAWRMPKVLERWILQAGFEGDQRAYFALTCGGGCGNAAHYARKLCMKKNLQFRGLAPVIMPENYLAMFPTPDAAQSHAIIQRARPQIDALAARILAGEPFPENPVTWAEKLESGPVNPLFYTFCVGDKGFRVSQACVSCGKCARRCPLNNIRLVDGRPVWQGHCTHCMACIGGCPTQAIAYKGKSAGRNRYYIMDDGLCWGADSSKKENGRP